MVCVWLWPQLPVVRIPSVFTVKMKPTLNKPSQNQHFKGTFTETICFHSQIELYLGHIGQITHGQPQATDSRLQAPDLRLQARTPGSKLQIPDSTLRRPDSRLQMADSRFQIADSRLQIADSRLQIPDSRVETPDSRLPIADSNILLYPIHFLPSASQSSPIIYDIIMSFISPYHMCGA